MKRLLIRLILHLAPLATLHAAAWRLADHLVPQSETAGPVSGWGDPGEWVMVEFAGQRQSTTANEGGKWMVKLDPLEARADSRELVVRSLPRNRRVKVPDVLLGEVRAGGGPSKMEFDLKMVTSAAVESAASANPALRQFHFWKNRDADTPADDVQGFWMLARLGTTEDFIAAGCYFAKSTPRELKMPAGLIKVCWGGWKVEPWSSLASLARVPELSAGASNLNAMSERNPAAFRGWLKRTQREDRGSGDLSRNLSGPASTGDGWVEVKGSGAVSDPSLPGYGAFWFRKEVAATARQTGTAQVLRFGPMAEFAQVSWSGMLIGERAVDSFTGLRSVRHYLIPPALLKDGVNQLAMRLLAPAEPPGCSRSPTPGATKIPDGWRAKANDAPPLLDAAGNKAVPPVSGLHLLTGSLFNGMVPLLLPDAIRGVLWCQGESDTGNASFFGTSFPLLSQEGRPRWQQGDFPFCCSEFANSRAPTTHPGESVWAELCEAEAKTSPASPPGHRTLA